MKTTQALKTKQSPTLMKYIERIVEATKDQKLSPESLEACAESTAAIAEKLSLTAIQTVFLAVFVDQCDDESIRVQDIARHFECRNVSVMCHRDAFDALTERGYIRSRKSHDNKQVWRVPQAVVEALQRGEAYTVPSVRGLTTEQLFDQLDKTYQARYDGDITHSELVNGTRDLVRGNPELAFCKNFLRLSLSEPDAVLLLLFCEKLVNEEDDALMFNDMEDIMPSKSLFNRLKRDLRDGSHALMERGLIEEKKSADLSSREVYHLTDKAKSDLLSELNLRVADQPAPKGILRAADIVAKPLFYNDRERAQIDQLARLLEDKNFARVQRRLTKNGMRRGFACLFHGAPGTGKTETVYQIARRTGRDILTVNVSEIKSMWVGESEKNIKGLFDKYRNFCAQTPRTPILLFNEADAVLGVRFSGAERAVDKMENSIQNIILQEMETLEGIMIATTNLTSNLDGAFERRFLFKIEFDRPGVEAKAAIWRSMMPELSDEAAAELAAAYQFSGGQIENIARRRTVDAVLHGRKPTLPQIHDYCRNESLSKQRRPIGF